jgi:hypothetical protein
MPFGKRRYVLAASLGVIGALSISGTASAAVTGFTYGATISPSKQSAKTLGPAAITSTLDTFYSGGSFNPTPTTTIVQFSKDIKFTPGNLAQCNLSSISTAPDSTAMSLCAKSKVGTGSVVVNNGALTGKVTAYNGVPSGGGTPPIGFHTDLFLPSGAYSFSTTGIGTLNTKTNTLTTPIPPTGTSLTHFEVAIGKIKTGKKKGKPTYYVMARCKKKKWTDTATEVFADGSSRVSTSTQKCKAKKK